MEGMSFGATYELFGLRLNLALFYIPLMLGISENAFKIHDTLSNIFKIRSNFDRDVIINSIIKRLNIGVDIKSLNDSQVDKLMNLVFYKYASSTKPVIDSHFIVLAIGEWCWLWIILDTALMLIITGAIFLIIKWSMLNAVLLVSAILCLVVIIMAIMDVNVRYAHDEIDAIFSDSVRADEILKEVNNALHN